MSTSKKPAIKTIGRIQRAMDREAAFRQAFEARPCLTKTQFRAQVTEGSVIRIKWLDDKDWIAVVRTADKRSFYVIIAFLLESVAGEWHINPALDPIFSSIDRDQIVEVLGNISRMKLVPVIS